jgi:cytochrome c oxidase subunit 1
MLNERLGKLNFWTWFLGFNLAFGPMHILGLQGMPRRIYTYDDSLGLNVWNMVSTVGAFIIAFSVSVFMFNIWHSHKRNRVQAPGDPWDARTLEWSISSPPPHYNFAEIPTVHALDEFWHRKYTEDDDGRPVRVAGSPGSEGDDAAHDDHGDDDHGHGIHMPSPSYFPLVAAFGLPVMGYGMVYGRSSGQSYVVVVLGALILLGGLFAWAMEPSAEPEEEGQEVIEPATDDQPALVTAGGEEPAPAPGPEESGS